MKAKRRKSVESKEVAEATRPKANLAAQGLKEIEKLAERLAVNDKHAATELEQILPKLEGSVCGSFEENKSFASELNSLFDRLGFRVRCSKCGEPARFVCMASNRMKGGAFFFYHTSTRHGGTATVPPLILVEKAPDKRRKIR